MGPPPMDSCFVFKLPKIILLDEYQFAKGLLRKKTPFSSCTTCHSKAKPFSCLSAVDNYSRGTRGMRTQTLEAAYLAHTPALLFMSCCAILDKLLNFSVP